MTCKICHGEKRVAVGWSQDLRKISGIRVEYDPCPRCTAPPHWGADEPARYDMSIHSNPSAAAWAAFFKQTFPDSDEDLMHGWFANAMMAMHDHMQPATIPYPAMQLPEVLALLGAVRAEAAARNLYLMTAPDRGGANGPKGQRKQSLEAAQAATAAALAPFTESKP